MISLGHPVGDELIRAVSERIASFASKNTIVSRFGGDEFVFYWDDIESAAALRDQLDTVSGRMSGTLEISGNRLRVQSSGGAVFAGARNADVDSLIVRADLALYKAKERGKNGWCLFEDAMEQAFRSRQLLKADLRTAVDQKGLRVVYQPIVSVDTMKIASCEALCRWDHPELGPISPATFIPLAEETGIISEITTFMLEAACAECIKWPYPLSVSVNLSAKDFRDASIIEKVETALRNTNLAPERLEIEVTETSLLDDKSAARRYVEELRQIGVRIALDDFGTGYSSLSYLHKLPLDKIKIDRSFLTDVIGGRALASPSVRHRPALPSSRLAGDCGGRRDLRTAQDAVGGCKAGPCPGLPVRLGADRVGHRNDVDDRLAFRGRFRQGRYRRASSLASLIKPIRAQATG